MADSGLQESALKLSICANFSHGSWLSGDKHERMREALFAYMEERGSEWFEELAVELGWEFDGVSGEAFLDACTVMQSNAMRRRGKFVKTKAWFGINSSFRDLIAAGDEDEAAPADEAEPAGAEGSRPKQILTKLRKAQLYKYYAGKGPVELFAEFMLQGDLRQHAVILTAVGAPLESKYKADLECQTSGDIQDMISWSVNRAQGRAWWTTTQARQQFHEPGPNIRSSKFTIIKHETRGNPRRALHVKLYRGGGTDPADETRSADAAPPCLDGGYVAACVGGSP
ncbi:unnamed protein product [Symbiodinium sp. CCMP2592]|nr:unnamed protein product [Symbiodinium sp. CCMP2592]CAE7365310.1 unnamed protein product [Symbiodinium sp. CCMP2592]CAE7632867.1 unnamed protein product [Symbiodinium sp. CCMP2592]